ncbi:hypothetical protein [Asaia krungthepensis]|uniref:hypothetical protein n=1 Tax=Asaia krungthepensis TaxID=220990 RepID=UPI0022323D45|nr:hypothetical protein [Asaia krungthepensis]
MALIGPKYDLVRGRPRRSSARIDPVPAPPFRRNSHSIPERRKHFELIDLLLKSDYKTDANSRAAVRLSLHSKSF